MAIYLLFLDPACAMNYRADYTVTTTERQMNDQVRRVLVAAAALAVALIPAGGASAAPLNFSGQQVITGWCDGEPVSVVPVAGPGIWTPYRIVGTNQVLVPYKVRFDLESGPPPDEQRTYEPAKTRHELGNLGVTFTKPGGIPSNATTCEFFGTITIDGTSYGFTGLVVGVVRGPA